MDKVLLEKINEVVGLKRLDKKTRGYQYLVRFSVEDESIEVVGEEGEFVYKLKELPELYAPEKELCGDIDWEDEYYLSLLNTMESAIRCVDDTTSNLTDTVVILALERLCMKPELKNTDLIIKEINLRLRYHLSLCDYTRNEVRRAIRKILESAKRHNKIDGIRGYLDFIAQFMS